MVLILSSNRQRSVQSFLGASPLSLPLAQVEADLPEQQEEAFPLLAVFLESLEQDDFSVFETVWPLVAVPPKATFFVDELASFLESATWDVVDFEAVEASD